MERAGRGTTLMSVLACANGWDTPWLGWGHLLSFVDLKYWVNSQKYWREGTPMFFEFLLIQSIFYLILPKVTLFWMFV